MLRNVSESNPPSYRHDDIVIQRRFCIHPATHAVKQLYAVTYPGHDDHGTEHDRLEEAQRAALTLAEGKKLTVWYEESPSTGQRTLVWTFRNPLP